MILEQSYTNIPQKSKKTLKKNAPSTDQSSRPRSPALQVLVSTSVSARSTSSMRILRLLKRPLRLWLDVNSQGGPWLQPNSRKKVSMSINGDCLVWKSADMRLVSTFLHLAHSDSGFLRTSVSGFTLYTNLATGKSRAQVGETRRPQLQEYQCESMQSFSYIGARVDVLSCRKVSSGVSQHRRPITARLLFPSYDSIPILSHLEHKENAHVGLRSYFEDPTLAEQVCANAGGNTHVRVVMPDYQYISSR